MSRKRPGVLDRVLRSVGLARLPARSTRTFYAGAATNRLNLDWVLGPASADDEVKADGRKLRDRARQLRRDNPWAARFVALQVEGILGAHGIAMQARVGTTRDTPHSRANDLLESRFARWGESFADVAGRLSFGEHVRLAVETWKAEGEAFIELVPMSTARNPFGFALRALDPDQIDDTYNAKPEGARAEVKMGVELDALGAPVAYHVWTRHPSEATTGGTRERRRIPASQIIHLGRSTRVGQTRFVTPFAPVLQDLKMLGGLQEAVLVLQRTAACKMGFLSVDPELTSPLEAEPGGTVPWDAEPGKIEQLPLGMQFTPWDPGQPGQEYDPFTKNVLRAIAAGLGVSYASLTGDLSEANYSSARVGMLSERDGYARDQRYLIAALHRRVYAEWLAWAFLSGALAELAPGGVDRYPVEWIPRPFPWIDPLKDIEASLLEVAAGVNSLTDIAAGQGRDFADVIQKRKQELALAREAGVTLSLGAAEPPPPPAPASDAPPPARALAIARSLPPLP